MRNKTLDFLFKLLYSVCTPPIAQLVEQRPFKPRVEGSNPSGRTNGSQSFRSCSTEKTYTVSEPFKLQCIALRERGYTLPEICRALGRGKSSVYFHIRTIPLPQEVFSSIAKKKVERFHGNIGRKKGVAVRPQPPSIEKEFVWTSTIVLLVAHLLFDGGVSDSYCAYYNRSLALIGRVENAMRAVYQHPPIQHTDKNGVTNIYYHNVALARFMQKKTEELLANVCTFERELQRAFLIAFFDDEGCVSHKGNDRKVRGYQHSKALLLLIQNLLTNFGIRGVIDKHNIEITIRGYENLLRFQKEINFSQGVCVNGERANSRWKQSLEKREILARALRLYKTHKGTKYY